MRNRAGRDGEPTAHLLPQTWACCLQEAVKVRWKNERKATQGTGAPHYLSQALKPSLNWLNPGSECGIPGRKTTGYTQRTGHPSNMTENDMSWGRGAESTQQRSRNCRPRATEPRLSKRGGDAMGPALQTSVPRARAAPKGPMARKAKVVLSLLSHITHCIWLQCSALTRLPSSSARASPCFPPPPRC